MTSIASPFIHSTAVISPRAKIDSSVRVVAFSVINEDSVIDKNVTPTVASLGLNLLMTMW